ncbi:MAG: hypothetical protein AAB458_02525 [Patescibacteria group bacterium]
MHSTQHIFKSLALTFLFIVTFLIPVHKSEAQLLTNFGGYLVDVDYITCSCGFIIFTVHDISKNVQYTIIWPYLAQALESLGVDFGFLTGFISRLYEYGMIIPGYEVNVLGNFFPYQNAVCAEISSTGCSVVTPGANGYLVGMGTSLLQRMQ